MAKGNGKGTDPQRTPFVDREREKAYELLAKAAVALHRAKESVKAHQETFDRLRDAIEQGGFLDETQTALPLDHPDDVRDPRPTWMRSHAEATYHLFVPEAESAHCDAPVPKDGIKLDSRLVTPNVERLCPECSAAPYPEVKEAKAIFTIKSAKSEAPLAAAQAQAKKQAGKGNHKGAE